MRGNKGSSHILVKAALFTAIALFVSVCIAGCFSGGKNVPEDSEPPADNGDGTGTASETGDGTGTASETGAAGDTAADAAGQTTVETPGTTVAEALETEAARTLTTAAGGALEIKTVTTPASEAVKTAETGASDAQTADTASNAESDSETPSDVMSAREIYSALQNAAELNEMFAAPPDVIPDYYGIFPDDYSDAVFMMSVDSMLADEYVIIRAAGDAEARRVYDRLKKRLQDKADEAKTYSPEQYAIILDGFLSTDGLWVAMLVSPEVDKLGSAYQKAIR